MPAERMLQATSQDDRTPPWRWRDSPTAASTLLCILLLQANSSSCTPPPLLASHTTTHTTETQHQCCKISHTSPYTHFTTQHLRLQTTGLPLHTCPPLLLTSPATSTNSFLGFATVYTGMGAKRAFTSSFAMPSSNSGCGPRLRSGLLPLLLLLPSTRAVLVLLPLPLLLCPSVRDCINTARRVISCSCSMIDRGMLQAQGATSI
jgi:hypothetical protein